MRKLKTVQEKQKTTVLVLALWIIKLKAIEPKSRQSFFKYKIIKWNIRSFAEAKVIIEIYYILGKRF